MLRQGQKLLHKGLLLALVAVLAITLLPTTSVLAQEQTVTVQVDGLLVYEQPNAASRLIAVMSLGSSITIVSSTTQNGFTNVRIPDGRTGWAILDVAGAPAGATGTGATTSGGVIVQAQGNVRIRATPSLSGQRLGYMGWGDTATLLGFDSSGKWGQVNFNGIVGWVAIDWFVVVSGDPSVLGQGGGQTLAAASVTTPAGGSTTTTDGLAVTVAPGTTVQAVGNVRLRDEPSLRGNKIALAAWGAIGNLVALDPTGDWILVNVEGVQGWSAAEWWVLLTGDIVVTNTATGAISTVSGQGGAAPAGTTATTTTAVTGATSGVTVMSLGNVRLRAAPSLSGDRLLSIEWGAVLPAFARTANGDWLLVSYNGVSGWVASEWFTVVSGDPNSLPVQ